MPLGCPLPDAVSDALRPGDATHLVSFRPRGFSPPRRLAPSGGRGSVAPRYRSEVRCVSRHARPGAVRRHPLSRSCHSRNAASYPSKDPTHRQPHRVTAAVALVPLPGAPCSAASATGDDSDRAPPRWGSPLATVARNAGATVAYSIEIRTRVFLSNVPTSHQHTVIPPLKRWVPRYSPRRSGGVLAAPGARSPAATRAVVKITESASAHVSGVHRSQRPVPTRRGPPKRTDRVVHSAKRRSPTRARRAEVDGVQGAAVHDGDAPVHRGGPPRHHDIEVDRPKSISRCLAARPAHHRGSGTSERTRRDEAHGSSGEPPSPRHIEQVSCRDCEFESTDVSRSRTEVPSRHAMSSPPVRVGFAGLRTGQPLG
jgi:hypothetical protein